jgi:phosphoenolpyruvate carboxylase
MSKHIRDSYRELVELKYQLYNSLFLTLPLDAVQQAGLLLPLLQEDCIQGISHGESPAEIITRFFKDHKPSMTERERITFLFKVIQYVERQVVLIDALEESAYKYIHRIGDSDSWEKISRRAGDSNLQEELEKVLQSFSLRLVLTAHPTQFYPGRVLAIANDLTSAIKKGDVALVRDLLQQLGRTPFYRKKKPTVFDEAQALIWYLGNVFYSATGELLDNLSRSFPEDLLESGQLIRLGFWPGGDRDGNPFVRVDTTLKVSRSLRSTLCSSYLEDISSLKRRLSFDGVYEILTKIEEDINAELTHPGGEQNVDYNAFIKMLDEIETVLVEKHQSLFLDKLKSFKRKVKLFGFHFATLDIRQDSRVINRTFNHIIEANQHLVKSGFAELSAEQQLIELFSIKKRLTHLPPSDDSLIQDTMESFSAIRDIQRNNGEKGAHRYIISNCRGPIDVARVYALARLCGWGDEVLSLDIVPLFETIDDLRGAGDSMIQLYQNDLYIQHLKNRDLLQTVMLGFSDGTKDGGYLMANWSIYRAKEDVTAGSRDNGIKVIFFDGRGGPPARGGGNAHLFYSAMGNTIENREIQLTIQGQTISSHYGIKRAAVHNLGHLLTAGIENNVFKKHESDLDSEQRELINQLSVKSFEKYQELKSHPLFISYLEERSTLKYYGMANIGSRPSKRGADKQLVFEDLRAIPFVGAWSQQKQNVPGFYGLGTALKQQEENGMLESCKKLYQSSLFFRALISNSAQSMAKTNFNLTKYVSEDPKYGEFWKLIYNEFILSREMVLKVSDQKELLEDNDRSRMSISLRERIVLPLLVIQQNALIEIQKKRESGNPQYIDLYERMVMRSLFGNINASRNSV